MTRKSLKDAVLDVAVAQFAVPAKTFSAYDVTKVLRSDVNAKKYDISEFVGIPTPHTQEVSHTAVRDKVEELYNTGYLNRSFNGTFFEYSVGTIRQTVKDITTDPLYNRFVAVIVNVTAIDATQIAPSTTLVASLGIDDLDLVEIVMDLESEFKSELKGNELPEPAKKISTVEDLFNVLTENIKKASTTTSAQVAVVAPVSKSPTPTTTPKDVLKIYIGERIAKGVNPKLKNAQKHLGSGVASVRDISNWAKELGFFVNQSAGTPFNQWTISK